MLCYFIDAAPLLINWIYPVWYILNVIWHRLVHHDHRDWSLVFFGVALANGLCNESKLILDLGLTTKPPLGTLLRQVFRFIVTGEVSVSFLQAGEAEAWLPLTCYRRSAESVRPISRNTKPLYPLSSCQLNARDIVNISLLSVHRSFIDHVWVGEEQSTEV